MLNVKVEKTIKIDVDRLTSDLEITKDLGFAKIQKKIKDYLTSEDTKISDYEVNNIVCELMSH